MSPKARVRLLIGLLLLWVLFLVQAVGMDLADQGEPVNPLGCAIFVLGVVVLGSLLYRAVKSKRAASGR